MGKRHDYVVVVVGVVVVVVVVQCHEIKFETITWLCCYCSVSSI